MKRILFNLFADEILVNAISRYSGIKLGQLTLHRFPDEETLIKIESDVKDKHVILVTSLVRANPKILPILFFAETARNLGASKVSLVAPYLPYMRQDKPFHLGEGVTSRYFARLLSDYFDGLLTVDPHLHRYRSLQAIYPIATRIVHAQNKLAEWILENVEDPLLIGPDGESEQWVASVATLANAPFTILEKTRKGDRDVAISVPRLDQYHHRTPILLDDIISTARTMIETINHLKSANMKPPICIGVHAVFSDNAYEDLLAAGASKIITCNTILHPSNAIDLSSDVAKSLNEFDDER